MQLSKIRVEITLRHWNMSSSVLVNNFVEPKNINIKIHIDFISKCLIYLGCIFGVHNISVLDITNKKVVWLLRCYYIIFNSFLIVIYLYTSHATVIILLLRFIDLFRFSLSTFLENVFHRRLYMFFEELNKFDDEIRENKFDTKSIYIIKMILVLIICLCLNFVAFSVVDNFLSVIYIWVLLTFDVMQLYYYGHLFSLILRRIKLITKYLKLSYLKPQSYLIFYSDFFQTNVVPKRKQKKYMSSRYYTLQKITNMYNKIIIIHDCLYSATKWQVSMFLHFKIVLTIKNNVEIKLYIIFSSYFC